MGARRGIGVVGIVVALCCAGCSTVPNPPQAVGEDFPGTCMPDEFSWPTDFLGSLAGESSAVGGRLVGLRLEFVDSEWVWRLRSADTNYDWSGDAVDDPSVGKESIVDVRTLKTIATHKVELTEAEQQPPKSSAKEAAKLSGEQWPSPLIIEMSRIVQDGTPAWQITTCDTETNEQSVMTVE